MVQLVQKLEHSLLTGHNQAEVTDHHSYRLKKTINKLLQAYEENRHTVTPVLKTTIRQSARDK